MEEEPTMQDQAGTTVGRGSLTAQDNVFAVAIEVAEGWGYRVEQRLTAQTMGLTPHELDMILDLAEFTGIEE